MYLTCFTCIFISAKMNPVPHVLQFYAMSYQILPFVFLNNMHHYLVHVHQIYCSLTGKAALRTVNNSFS